MAIGTITKNTDSVASEAGPVFVDSISFLGDSSYPTGGTAAFDTALRAITKDQRDIIGVIPLDCGGYLPAYDRATSKLKVYELDQGPRVDKAVKAVGFADLTDADGSQSFVFDAALPDNAVIIGVGIHVTAGFTDGAAGVFTADLGINGGDTDAFLDGASIATIADVGSPLGVRPTGLVGAITPVILVLADVNVTTATAGALEAEILYVVPGSGSANGPAVEVGNATNLSGTTFRMLVISK